MFITFEGIDGSGKTTLINKIYEYLKNHNYQVQKTREPGGEKIAEDIRKIILNPNNTSMEPWTEALLYIAARYQHIHSKILPFLNQKNVIVLCDRYFDSTIAYQGYGRSLNINYLKTLQLDFLKMPKPDLTFYLKINLKTALSRISKRVNNFNAKTSMAFQNKQKENNHLYLSKTDQLKLRNRLDTESDDFFYKTSTGFQNIIKDDPKRFVILNADNNLDEIFDEAINYLKKIL